MTNDIMTALKMLKAKGGALDMKAAEIIEDLFAQVVAKRVGEKMADDKAGQPDDRIAVLARQAHQIAQLTKEVVDLNAVLDGMKQMIDTLSGPAEREAMYHRDYLAVTAVLGEALEKVPNVPWGLKAHHWATLLAAEYHGAVKELDDVRIKLGRVLRREVGVCHQDVAPTYRDTDTAFALADEAAQELQTLRMQLADQVRNRVVHVTVPSTTTLPPENLWLADLLRMSESDA